MRVVQFFVIQHLEILPEEVLAKVWCCATAAQSVGGGSLDLSMGNNL